MFFRNRLAAAVAPAARVSRYAATARRLTHGCPRRPASAYNVVTVRSEDRVRVHGLRVERCGRPSGWPPPGRSGAVLAVHGAAFQRRPDAAAQRQLSARLRELGYACAFDALLRNIARTKRNRRSG